MASAVSVFNTDKYTVLGCFSLFTAIGWHPKGYRRIAHVLLCEGLEFPIIVGQPRCTSCSPTIFSRNTYLGFLACRVDIRSVPKRHIYREIT